MKARAAVAKLSAHAYLEAIEPAYRLVSLAINKNATVEAVARAMRNLWPFVSMTLSWKEISYAKAQREGKRKPINDGDKWA